MSAYSDWKCGAISDSEYTDACNREAAGDNEMEHSCYGCIHYKLNRNLFNPKRECEYDFCVKEEEEGWEE